MAFLSWFPVYISGNRLESMEIRVCIILGPRKQTVRAKLVPFKNRGSDFELLDGEQTNLPCDVWRGLLSMLSAKDI